jgi:PAS domain S-box-containing protein
MILDFSLKPINNDHGILKFIIAEGRDVTAYKRTREALIQSEARFETIFNKAGIGIVIRSTDGRILDCNPAFQSMLGWAAEELIQREYLEITHPLDRDMSRKLFNELVSGKRKSYFTEKRYLDKDGQVVWARNTFSLVIEPDGQAQFAVGMVENVTAQKQIESELIELRRRLMQGREMERLRLAQDLHDGPLQEIIGVTYQIKDLENELSEDGFGEQLKPIQDALHQLTQSIRAICGELRPPTLIPFGLEKAIRSHVEQFQTDHPGIEFELELDHDGDTLSEQIRIVLFRIHQEALNNIVRHAQASKVWVRFRLNEDQAILVIQDNGIGFELPNRWIKIARQGHLGLVGAMERAKEIGGIVEVITAPGQGTLVRAIIPLKEEPIQVFAELDKG